MPAHDSARPHVNGDVDSEPVTSRSPQSSTDWRHAAQPGPVLTGLLEIEGLLSNYVADTARGIDGIRAEHRTHRDMLDRIESQVVVLTAAGKHQSQAYSDLDHRVTVIGREVSDLKRGQEAIGRSVEFLAAEVRGGFEGLKGVVATKGEVAALMERQERTSDRVESVEDRVDQTGQFAAQRNLVLEHGEQERRKWLRGIAASILLLIAGGAVERACQFAAPSAHTEMEP